MKIKIKKDALLAGLAAVQGIIKSTTTLPILMNILVRAKGKRVDFTATDLDVTVAAGAEAEVEEEGSATVSARKLSGIVRELDGAEVALESDGKHVLSLVCGESAYHINGLDPAEWPAAAEEKAGRKVTLQQSELKEMLKRTSFAQSTEAERFVLNGTHFNLDKKLTAVATDGRRLALVADEFEGKANGEAKFTVPSKAVAEVERLLQEKGTVELEVCEGRAVFASKGESGEAQVTVTTKLIDGNFADYKRVIPAEHKQRVAVPREALLKALKRVSFMCTDKFNSVKLSFLANKLEVTVNAPDSGDGKETIAVKHKGPDVAIAFNPQYVVEPLSALDDDEVFFELTDELSPAALKVNGPFLYVVMPLRLS